MKLNFKVFLSLSLVVFSMATLNCGSPSGGNTSAITISFSNAPGKAAVGIDQLRHEISLSGPTGIKTFTITGAGSVNATVAVGHWTISVQGFLGDELYAVGSGSAEVKAGLNTNVTIQMTVVWSEPKVPDNQPPLLPSYYFVTEDSYFYTLITLTAKAKTAVPDGNYTYTAELLGVIISSGTATVSNGIFTFLASDGDTFDYDATAGIAAGSITLTPAKIAEIEAAVGMGPLGLPSTLSILYITGVEKGGGSNYWNGEWIRESVDGTLLSQKLVFSGAYYTLSDGTNTESGTFTYNDNSTATIPNTENVFVFFRPGNKVAVYNWEGMADDPTIPPNNFLELKNRTFDPMGVGIDFTSLDELWDAIADATFTYGPGSPEETLAQAEYDAAYDANPNGFRKQ